jgi:DNA-directed RNA polymerase subunit F
METNETNDPSRSEEGKNVTEGTDQEYLRKAEDELPDGNQMPEQTDALIGDVHPTDRSEITQEESNANNENQSDSSKISGESL